jgi:hypothetical protein
MSKKIVGWVIAGVVALLILIVAITFIGYSNDEVKLRNLATARQEANKNTFDKVWKTISQVAQVSEQYKESFKDVFLQSMDKRYAGDKDVVMKWVQEQNPNLSTRLYEQLNDAIQANRAEFARVQNELIDIKREHDNLRKQWPSSMVVGKRDSLTIVIVTSAKTKAIFGQGEENDVQLFGNKK